MTKHFLAVCLCIVTLSACQSTNQSSQPEGTANQRGLGAVLQAEDGAKDRALNQRYSSAADQRLRAILRRVQQALQSRRAEQAASLLAGANVNDRAPELQDAFFRLSAKIYNEQGESQAAALALISIQSPRAMDAPIFLQTCMALNERQCFLRAQIVAQQINGKFLQEEQDRLWLKLMNDQEPLTLERTSAAPKQSQNLGAQLAKIQTSGINAAKVQRISQGWRDLQTTIAAAGSITQAQLAWQRWQRTHPEHPAVKQPPTLLRQLSNFSPPKISILLPISGRLNTVASAIRDGVMAGYFADLKVQQEPNSTTTNMVFIDSNKQNAAGLFNHALAADSDVIVGPLIKSKASDLLELRRNLPPATATSQPSIVLLNHVSQNLTPKQNRHVYQFAVAIEDEAITLANHLKAKGHLRLMVVTNGETWSQRAKKALKDTWNGPLAEANFQQAKEVTNVVGMAMGVDASQRRRERLVTLIDEDVGFLPRGRKDLDAAVAFTNSLESKALVPALKFHFADNLPVYGTSQTARGNDLKELAAFQVTELPMLAQPTKLTKQMTATLQLQDRSLIELYALGLDAYRLATWSHWLKNNSAVLPNNQVIQLNFASGNLTLGLGGVIHRKLQITTIARADKNRQSRGS
jgi:outer membrane PBP1 activator LpoA protein